MHFIATLWSNLQVCKISSRAEIPKLDRVWQLLKTVRVCFIDIKIPTFRKIVKMTLYVLVILGLPRNAIHQENDQVNINANSYFR